MFLWFLRTFLMVKQIASQEGDVHFQRFRLFSTRKFSVYLHRILRSDRERHMHDHPWDFWSIILWGSYLEEWVRAPEWSRVMTRVAKFGTFIRHDHADAHKLTLRSKVVWTLVFAGPHSGNWGYQTETGWVDHWLYRQRKRSYQLDSMRPGPIPLSTHKSSFPPPKT